MMPEANKQQQRSSVDLYGHGWLSSPDGSKLRATHRTNWQWKLMCNWAVVHFTEPVGSSAAEITRRRLSHITMAHFQHTAFGTYYFSPCKCKKKKENNPITVGGLLSFQGLSWHVYDEWEEMHIFSANFSVVNKGLHSPQGYLQGWGNEADDKHAFCIIRCFIVV